MDSPVFELLSICWRIYGHAAPNGAQAWMVPPTAQACAAHVPVEHSDCVRHAWTRVPPPPPQSAWQLADAGCDEKSKQQTLPAGQSEALSHSRRLPPSAVQAVLVVWQLSAPLA